MFTDHLCILCCRIFIHLLLFVLAYLFLINSQALFIYPIYEFFVENTQLRDHILLCGLLFHFLVTLMKFSILMQSNLSIFSFYGKHFGGLSKKTFCRCSDIIKIFSSQSSTVLLFTFLFNLPEIDVCNMVQGKDLIPYFFLIDN